MPRENAAEDRFVGCLLGLAIGDALGMPFEGMPAGVIARYHGRVTDLRPGRGLGAGQFTDDTQMAICIAESIVARGRVDPADVAERFVAWFEGGDVRGIGGACLEGILNLRRGVPWWESGKRGRWAAGNGAAMRIAPVGLLDCRDLERLRKDVHDVSIITHRNAEAVAGAQAVAYAVAKLATGKANPSALLDEVVAFIGRCEVARSLARAKELLAADTPTAEALAVLGTSGYVVHTVASAFYCFLRTPRNFERTVIAAVMGGRDTDTVAAIAGAISGAHNGVGGIPKRWLEGVEDAERLADLARKIYLLQER